MRSAFASTLAILPIALAIVTCTGAAAQPFVLERGAILHAKPDASSPIVAGLTTGTKGEAVGGYWRRQDPQAPSDYCHLPKVVAE